MSALSEAGTEHLTVSELRESYGLISSVPFSGAITITSLADDLDSISPGALYMPADSDIDEDVVLKAERRGAYVVLLPLEARDHDLPGNIPVLYGDLSAAEKGALAARIAGHPSHSVAVFLVMGEHCREQIAVLANLLHVIGNPVGQIGFEQSLSLERHLAEEYPLSELDIQRMLSVFIEDGASAVVIGADKESLKSGALESVVVDVCAICDDAVEEDEGHSSLKAMMDYYGAVLRERTHLAHRSGETDEMAHHFDPAADPAAIRRLSLALAMVMKAGVRKSNIKSALRVSKEMK